LERLKQEHGGPPRNYRDLLGPGIIFRDLGRVAESELYLRRACALEPERAEAHYNLALTLLLAGEYREGFREYEWRRRTKQFAERLPHYASPVWDGSELEGRRILIHAAQGDGDVIQFSRYMSFVRERGGSPILHVPASLVRLMSWLPDCGIVAALDSAPPAFDVQCPMLSLALLAGTDLDCVPPPAQFAVPADLQRKWNVLLGEKTAPRVGIDLLAPIRDVAGLHLFSLRAGLAGVRDLSPELSDYAETAAAISQLDLIVTVDSAVAHLAGSLGIPVWMLIPFAPDWRWLLERADSPWYPGMRLFRQTTRGDWDGVVNSVTAALDEFVDARSPHAASGAPVVNLPEPDPAVDERARMAADFIPAGAVVLDLACGSMAIERYLPPGCRYLPCDAEAIAIPSGVTHITALGIPDCIQDRKNFLQQLRATGLPVVFGLNQASVEEFSRQLAEAGFHVRSSLRDGGNQAILRVTPEETRLTIRHRVLVVSYNNSGNFGDRLGFHLLNSLLPADAEVHYAHFRPWDVPEGDFDLLVVGIGNSIFNPILTDRLISLARRIPHSVGIFGTQYRESIDRNRMSRLLDSLTVWFARHEEDMLLYGSGRQNAIHLGDWLIGAFPMTRWTRDEALRIGKEMWNDLPLDRTIERIQKYRTVTSERIHPLLCALTSAERVAFSEQQEDGTGRSSGKFRSLLLDIFGRTWPESTLFEVDREAVALYRARVLRVTSTMPQVFAGLLGAKST